MDILSEAVRDQAEVVVFGDSIVYNMCRYPPLGDILRNTTNGGIPGDRAENVLWRVENGPHLPLSVRTVIVHCGINDILAYNGSAVRSMETYVCITRTVYT